jgi:hypothetical protein
MHQTALNFDPCTRAHNPQSVAAFTASDRESQRRRVLEAIENAKDGLTVDELSAMWQVGANVVSGRFTELKTAGLITVEGTRRTRAGCQAGIHRAKRTTP